MKHIKLFEAFETGEFPRTVTVRFFSDGFMDHFWSGTPGQKVYQMHRRCIVGNLQNLQGEGHPNYGDGGLEMEMGSYYPLFKVFDEKDPANTSIWYYVAYWGDEIGIVQSSEHSEYGHEIPHRFDSLKKISANWYCRFDEGTVPGAVDHRGWFKIVAVR